MLCCSRRISDNAERSDHRLVDINIKVTDKCCLYIGSLEAVYSLLQS